MVYMSKLQLEKRSLIQIKYNAQILCDFFLTRLNSTYFLGKPCNKANMVTHIFVGILGQEDFWPFPQDENPCQLVELNSLLFLAKEKVQNMCNK